MTVDMKNVLFKANIFFALCQYFEIY